VRRIVIVASLASLLVPAAAVALLTPGRTVPNAAPVTALSVTHRSVVYAVGRTKAACGQVRLWDTGTRGLWSFGERTIVACEQNPSGGYGIAQVATTGRRVFWVTNIGGNFTDYQLWTATATQGGLASAKRVDRLVAEVRKAKAAGQVPIVFLHWGTERQTCPNPQQVQLGQTLRDAGAAAVIGGHAHRVLSGGYLGDAYVDYGLGNFGFYAAGGAASKTGVLTLTFDKGKVVKDVWAPGVIVNRSPQPLSGEAAASALAEWNALRSCTNLTPTPAATGTTTTTAAP